MPAEIVYIEQRTQAKRDSSTLRLLNKMCHSRFQKLLGCYHYEERLFQLWEPVALSVTQILASKCMITETEILAILRPDTVSLTMPAPNSITGPRKDWPFARKIAPFTQLLLHCFPVNIKGITEIFEISLRPVIHLYRHCRAFRSNSLVTFLFRSQHIFNVCFQSLILTLIRSHTKCSVILSAFLPFRLWKKLS